MSNLQDDNPFLKIKARNLFLWFFIITILVGIASAIIIGYTGFSRKDPIMTYIYYCLSFGLLCVWVLRRFYKLKINVRYLIGNFPKGYNLLPVFGLVVAVLTFSVGAGLLSFYVLSLIAPSFWESLLKSMNADQAKFSSVPILYNSLKVFSLVLVAPITEEFLFRGVLLHRWATKWGITPAILSSSILFGCLHMNPFGASIFGIVMTLLYFKTRTLIVPMIAHSMNNFLTIYIHFSKAQTNSANFHLWFGLLCVVLSAPFLVRFIYKKWPNQRISLPYFANASQ
jgi:hypothetical protein